MNWEPYTVSGQTAGYLTKWTGTKLAFATVHGAGHEASVFVLLCYFLTVIV